MHCDDPACMKVCPMKAIHKGPHGEVLVDQQKCIGCKMCANACPYDVPVFNTEGRTSYFGDKQPLVVRPAKPHTERTPGKAEHCTLCVHRTERGLLPACVEACGIHAMTLVDYDNPTPETAKLIEAARPMNEAAGTHPKIRYIARRRGLHGKDAALPFSRPSSFGLSFDSFSRRALPKAEKKKKPFRNVTQGMAAKAGFL